jgi:hypothetical protein
MLYCLLAANDLKAARVSQRVARPAARRPHPTLTATIRRGCRPTAYIIVASPTAFNRGLAESPEPACKRAPVITKRKQFEPPQHRQHHLRPLPSPITRLGTFPRSFLAGSSYSALFVLSYPVRAHKDLNSRFSTLTASLVRKLEAHIVVLFSSYVRETG